MTNDSNVLFYVERKNGEFDFGVMSSIQDLSHKDMKDLREMIIVAIGTMEENWRREQSFKNPAAEVIKENVQR